MVPAPSPAERVPLIKEPRTSLQKFFEKDIRTPKLVVKRKTFLLVWLLVAAPVAMQAQFTYTVTNQTVTITGYTGASLHVVIPSTINGLPVTSIGSAAFSSGNVLNILSFTIPDSLTNIADDAFHYCSSLT